MVLIRPANHHFIKKPNIASALLLTLDAANFTPDLRHTSSS